jgi:hypothetical protein
MGYTGRGQVVTFLDDGLEYDHPDLTENYVCLSWILLICKNKFFCFNRIKKLVQILMEMTMILHHVMSQLMKTSKIFFLNINFYRKINQFFLDMELDVLVK